MRRPGRRPRRANHQAALSAELGKAMRGGSEMNEGAPMSTILKPLGTACPKCGQELQLEMDPAKALESFFVRCSNLSCDHLEPVVKTFSLGLPRSASLMKAKELNGPLRLLPGIVVSSQLLAPLVPVPLAAQEPPAPAAHEGAEASGAHEAEPEEHEHANELAVFLGATRENDETFFTIGGEYERRLSVRFGLSLVVEHVSDIDAWVALAPFSFRPAKGLGLKIYAGRGFESKLPEGGEHGEKQHRRSSAAPVEASEEVGKGRGLGPRAGPGGSHPADRARPCSREG